MTSNYFSLHWPPAFGPFGSGWRSLFHRRDYLAAAVLIEDYLKNHRELTVGQRMVLHFHAAQLFALSRRTERAAEEAEQAISHEKAEADLERARFSDQCGSLS